MTALHPHILEARNQINVQRYRAKRAYHARSLAGIPDHRTDAERLAYSRMMVRRVTSCTTIHIRFSTGDQYVGIKPCAGACDPMCEECCYAEMERTTRYQRAMAAYLKRHG
jgi:hypothetical protein